MKKIFHLVLPLIAISLRASAKCWVKLPAGATRTLAIKNDGSRRAWGNNFGGRLIPGSKPSASLNYPQAYTQRKYFQAMAVHSNLLNSNFF